MIFCKKCDLDGAAYVCTDHFRDRKEVSQVSRPPQRFALPLLTKKCKVRRLVSLLRYDHNMLSEKSDSKLKRCNGHTHIHAQTHIYTHIQTYTHIHTHIYTHTHIHTYTHRHTHIYTHIHTYTHTCRHTHTYTHTPDTTDDKAFT